MPSSKASTKMVGRLHVLSPPPGPSNPSQRRLTRNSDDHLLADFAEQLYEERRLRESVFGNAFFGEPAWDILLDLYISLKRNKLVSVSDACLASGVPSTTSLRSLGILTTNGLVERSRDHTDRRRTFVRLTRTGEDLMTAYLRSIAT